MLKQIKTMFMIFPLIILYLAVQLFLQNGKINKTLNLSIPENIGINEELMEKVDQLEKDITRRLNYEVELERDPLKLSTILKVSNGSSVRNEFNESRRNLRLSCTILSPRGHTAVIKHKSKSYVLKEGDSILKWIVKSISKKQVVLISNNNELILENKPAPKIEAYFDKKREEDALKL